MARKKTVKAEETNQESPGKRAARTRDEHMRSRGYVTPLEAARMVCMAPQTIYAWIYRGALEVERIGPTQSKIYVSLESLRKVAGSSVLMGD